MPITAQEFTQKMLDFYRTHGRKDLPWQQNPTPYRVWISEIMLQQTQVKTVIPYYQKFIRRFSNLSQLAGADIDEVLHLWQGLGYYSRARNLHRCAQQLKAEFGGEFPDTLEAVQSLPGIGRSTAGAILSLAMGQSTPILDGNVKRILARFFLVDGWYGKASVEKRLWQLSEAYTPKESTAQFNQAMMDLGASLCSRTRPQCDLCPLTNECLARIQDKTAEYPHKKPRKTLPTKSSKFLLQLNPQGQLQLLKRPPSGIWGGLWCLPELSSEDKLAAKELCLIDKFRHSFTHFHLQASVIQLDYAVNRKLSILQENPHHAWHNIDQLKALALPTPIRKFLFKHFQIKE